MLLFAVGAEAKSHLRGSFGRGLEPHFAGGRRQLEGDGPELNVKITDLEIILIGRPPGLGEGGEGEFLVSPLSALPESGRLAGDCFVGLRGGPAYAVLVRVHTDDGLDGVGSVGVG